MAPDTFAKTGDVSRPARGHEMSFSNNGSGWTARCNGCELDVIDLATAKAAQKVARVHLEHLSQTSKKYASCSCGWGFETPSATKARLAFRIHENGQLGLK
jgi:hypothetical protein